MFVRVTEIENLDNGKVARVQFLAQKDRRFWLDRWAWEDQVAVEITEGLADIGIEIGMVRETSGLVERAYDDLVGGYMYFDPKEGG